MIVAAWMVLQFEICPVDGRMCEEGQTVARTCEQAERFVRAGLRPNQTIKIHDCVPWASTWAAPRP